MQTIIINTYLFYFYLFSSFVLGGCVCVILFGIEDRRKHISLKKEIKKKHKNS